MSASRRFIAGICEVVRTRRRQDRPWRETSVSASQAERCHRLVQQLGFVANLLVLLAVVISAGNAMSRYAFNLSSNAWLEVQWYMFAVIVMYGASYTLRRNESVRVEIFYLMLSERAQLWLDLICTILFLLPVCLLLAYLSWPFFQLSYGTSEVSGNAGGLIRWPIKFVLPSGFVLLALQGVSEIISASPRSRAWRKWTPTTRGHCNDPDRMDAAADVRRPRGFHAGRLSGGLLARGAGIDRPALIAMHQGSSPSTSCRRSRRACSATCCRTSCCWRSRSSPSWDRCSNAAVSPGDMLDSMGQLFGPIRGGLGYSVIIVGFILGAITGTVTAQVIAMALISMPVMIRYGYNMRYTTGVLAASGTITQHVPPSLVLIVLADQLGKSVGDMYLGAWGPSVFQVFVLFAAYTFLPERHQAASPSARAEGGAHAHRVGAVEEMPDGDHPIGGADLRRPRHHDARPRHADPVSAAKAPSARSCSP